MRFKLHKWKSTHFQIFTSSPNRKKNCFRRRTFKSSISNTNHMTRLEFIFMTEDLLVSNNLQLKQSEAQPSEKNHKLSN
jgi:hypothetical protein